MPVTNNPYVAATVTLAAANTNYNLYSLLSEIVEDASPMARELTIQAGSATVLVGGEDMTADSYGYELEGGESRTYRSDACQVPVAAINVRSETEGATVNVESILY